MGPIEYALFSEACRWKGSPLVGSPPVDPELDCLAEAIARMCRHHGFKGEQIAEFLFQIAGTVHELEPQFKGRRKLRRIEQRLLVALGRGEKPSRESGM